MPEYIDATNLPAYFTVPQVFLWRATGDLQATLRLIDAPLVQVNWREEARSNGDPSFVQEWEGPDGLRINANFHATMQPLVERCRKGRLEVRGRNRVGKDEVISKEAWARCLFFLSDGRGFVAETGNRTLASVLRSHRAGYDIPLSNDAKALHLWTDVLLPAEAIVRDKSTQAQYTPPESDPLSLVGASGNQPQQAGHDTPPSIAPAEQKPAEGDALGSIASSEKRRRGPYEARQKALGGIAACFPNGLPSEMLNAEIIRLVQSQLETTHGKQGRLPSPDTILRAAGRKKG